MDNQNVEPDLLTEPVNNEEVDKTENSTQCLNENSSLTVDSDVSAKRKSNVNKFHANSETSKDHWKTVEELVNALQKENDRLTNQLAEERHRSFINQKKLRYIQEHQDIFERLKDAYLKNKTNINPLIDFKEKTSSKIEETDCLTIQRKDLNAVKCTLSCLKNCLTSSPPRNYEIRETKFRKDIAILFKENMALNEQIKTKNFRIETLKKQLNAKKTQNKILKKIVAKLLRKMGQNRNVKYSVETLLNITESEKKIIEFIKTKYVKRESEENMPVEASKSTHANDMSEDNGNLTPYYTPRVTESP